MNREQRFAKVEHAENTGETLKRIAVYFGKERGTVCGMLAVVLLGTLCGIYAPSLQSKAIDIIVILSILVDTFISKISLTMQPGPKIDSISGA